MLGGVSVHQRKPVAQCHFDILQQLRSAMVHSKTSLLGKRRLYPVGGGANNWRDGKVKVADI